MGGVSHSTLKLKLIEHQSINMSLLKYNFYYVLVFSANKLIFFIFSKDTHYKTWCIFLLQHDKMFRKCQITPQGPLAELQLNFHLQQL